MGIFSYYVKNKLVSDPRTDGFQAFAFFMRLGTSKLIFGYTNDAKLFHEIWVSFKFYSKLDKYVRS